MNGFIYYHLGDPGVCHRGLLITNFFTQFSTNFPWPGDEEGREKDRRRVERALAKAKASSPKVSERPPAEDAELSKQLQGGPLLVINGVITPINGLINR